MAAFAKPGLSKEQDPDLRPSSITHLLSRNRPLSVSELVNLPNYNEQTVSCFLTTSSDGDKSLCAEFYIAIGSQYVTNHHSEHDVLPHGSGTATEISHSEQTH